MCIRDSRRYRQRDSRRRPLGADRQTAWRYRLFFLPSAQSDHHRRGGNADHGQCGMGPAISAITPALDVYKRQGNYFAAGVTSGPLYALSSGESGGNGVYRYGSGGGFPNSTYNASNYWVDVVFTTATGPDVTPPTVTGRTPASGATGVGLTTTVTATFSEALDAATVTGTSFRLLNAGVPVAAGVSYNCLLYTSRWSFVSEWERGPTN